MKTIVVLGISCWYHDSAAALVQGGEIIAAAQEERFSRVKNDPNFPSCAIDYCLRAGRISLEDVDAIVFYEKPLLKFDRIIESAMAAVPCGWSQFSQSVPIWVADKIFQKKTIKRLMMPKLASKSAHLPPILFSTHHLSHAASAFYPSPFNKAAIVTIDAVGEWATTSIGVGDGDTISTLVEQHYPHSLGLLYSAFTQLLGFEVNSGEYKVMGLAPYGRPTFVDLIKARCYTSNADGSFYLNCELFGFLNSLEMINPRLEEVLGVSRRQKDEPISQVHMDLAASIQQVCEELVEKIVQYAVALTGLDNICLAGGVALNCVANGKLLKRFGDNKIWVQPAAGDAGGALGAALAFYHSREPHDGRGVAKKRKDSDQMKGCFLGPEFSDLEIRQELDRLNAQYVRLDDDELLSEVVGLLVEGDVLGWFQGRMEWGPRALGARSIIADARRSDMQRKINLKVKFREGFRPFAPAVLEEHYQDWFDTRTASPFMSFVSQVLPSRLLKNRDEKLLGFERLSEPRSEIPSVTHVDNSARYQTVNKVGNPRFYALLKEFFDRTGCPVLVNTSFNINDEPIVCSPTDAYRCFLNSDLDGLVIGNFLLLKSKQVFGGRLDYHNSPFSSGRHG